MYLVTALVPCKANLLKFMCILNDERQWYKLSIFFWSSVTQRYWGKPHHFYIKQIYVMEQNAKLTWIFKIKQMTSKKCHTCCRSLGERVQSSLSLGALGWVKFMKHCLKNWKVVLFCFGFTLFIYLVIIPGRVEASRQSEGWECLLNRSSHHSYEVQNQIVHCNFITRRINKIYFCGHFLLG